MELECKTTHLTCYDTVLDTTLYQEETLESIVPDACPDILRIVDTEAVVCLKSKEAQEGRIEVAGTARLLRWGGVRKCRRNPAAWRDPIRLPGHSCGGKTLYIF